MNTTPIEGTYYRVAEPFWDDPLDVDYAAGTGGRWNPPGEPCLYVNRDEATSRARITYRLEGSPFAPEDLDPATAPVLVSVTLPAGAAADAHSDEGLAALGLPTTFLFDADGRRIDEFDDCQAAARRVIEDGLDGIDARSSVPGGTRELAWFPRGRKAVATATRTFDEWWPSGA